MRSVVDEIRSARIARLLTVRVCRTHDIRWPLEHRVASLLWFMARALLFILVPTLAGAQGGSREHTGTPADGWQFCRLQYDRVRTEADGNGWTTDYPQADRNLMIRVSELTTIRVAFEGDRFPSHKWVRGDSPHIHRCPWIMATDVGTMRLSEAEVAGLRAWLLKGGFLWFDDYWGEAAWYFATMELGRLLPGARIIDLDVTHPALVAPVPQVAHISFWKSRGGETSERGEESAEVDVRGVEDEHGRLMVLMTHDTDISDGFERESDPEFFEAFSPDTYSIGIGVLLYAMSH